ncbi:hypothetical protein QR680_008828 [Steinernema hermaphroditum]|uniref:Serine/threonine specific protein phosphatases domain-containing protein n=1 Tax=Steinernema hermaphroditum TaxID=289476 RepID=A0AA39IKI7_9BILA|nr:hypothetical protein QR680_008828 [Steinernema hermaphroditum]
MSQNSIATSEEKKKQENSDEQHSDQENVPESDDSSSSDEEELATEVAKDIVQIPLVNLLICKLLSAKMPEVPAEERGRNKDPLSRPTAPLIEVEPTPDEIFKLHLFMGDYVDRGAQGIEVAMFLLALKIKFPTKVFLLLGNHEDRHTMMAYGFYDECMKRYADSGEEIAEKVFNTFITVFNYLPLSAQIDGVILCMHGGLSPYMTTIDDIDKIQYPCIIPAYGLVCDLVWSDPTVDETRDSWSMSPRGISFNFGPSIVKEEQLLQDEYKFACKDRVLTVFSAPNYQNQKNDGAMLRISKNHQCRLVILRTTKKKKRQEIEDDCTE